MIVFNCAVRVVLLLAITVAIAGCTSTSVESRLALDIQQLRQTTAEASMPSWFSSMANRCLLDMLTNINSCDLSEPHLLVSVLCIKSDDVVLIVLWAEDVPSVTGIELIGCNAEKRILQIPIEYTIQNAKDSKRSVIFRSVYRWQLENMPSVLNVPCKVRLIASSHVTNASSLIVYERLHELAD